MGHVADREPPDGITRHFTVAVFVVHEGHVLLHPHPAWASGSRPAGTSSRTSLPDDAARREALEETGLPVRLVGAPGIDHDEPGAPRHLLRPEGVQVEDISQDPPHQHIDLIYFATLADGHPGLLPSRAGRTGRV